MTYVYIHYKPTGEPFYVGKGTEQRCNSFAPRNHWYANIVYKYGSNNILISKIECSNDDIAFELEKGMIKRLKDQGYQLTNMTEGGEGFESGHTPWHKGSTGLLKAWNKGLKLPKQSKETIEKRRASLQGYKHENVTCTKCGHIGAGPSMKRWHFNNCTGKHIFKSRVTVNGKRIFLGNYATKEEADMIAKKYKDSVTIPDGSTWTIV
jgi:hypothetical protein